MMPLKTDEQLQRERDEAKRQAEREAEHECTSDCGHMREAERPRYNRRQRRAIAAQIRKRK